jgi:hypothetical protein
MYINQTRILFSILTWYINQTYLRNLHPLARKLLPRQGINLGKNG